MKLLIFVLAIFICTGCTPQTPTKKISYEINFFLIDPDTFLSDFRNRDFSAFEAHGNIRPEEELVLGELIADWSTDDFSSIAEEAHNIIWDERIDGWELQVIQFGWDCEHVSDSPQEAYYSFYKVEENGDDSFKFNSDISIVPRRKTITVSQSVYSPVNNAPLNIPFPEVEEAMLEALDVAENNGGSEILELFNSCNISITFNPSLVKGEGWIVKYWHIGGTIKEFYIDPVSGEIIE
ncbi:MAG: hypothetical protein D8M60_19915 [Chloroflexi bacterium]|nr:hypothetical protein [Chloroflexota bacterium]